MTYTLNGIGTRLVGERKLTKEEITKWKNRFPQCDADVSYFNIATECFVFFYVPIIPLKTIIYYYTQKNFKGSQYMIVCRPPGKWVNWNHILKSPGFYILPIVILVIVVLQWTNR